MIMIDFEMPSCCQFCDLLTENSDMKYVLVAELQNRRQVGISLTATNAEQ